MIKTVVEIEELKQNWLSDACWDIETTEGFEDYHDELLAYRLEIEELWKAKRMADLKVKAEKMGIPDNLKLAEYIDYLEHHLERMIDTLGQQLEKHIGYK
jgi:hypothetical protein